ncbi:MAG: WD40 repeat domain-containing protein, partial [Eubacteriales bacterium]|nr:WD40 repeat domain-containing protein [Eubacteriales bacterium]
ASVYSIDSMELLAMVKFPGQAVKAVSISPDGAQMLCGYQDGILRLWDVETHSCIREYPQRSGAILGAALHPDKRIAAVSCQGSDTRIIRLDTGQCLRSFQRETGSPSSDIPYGTRFEDGGKSLAFTVKYINWKAVVPYEATDQVKVSLPEFQPRCSYFLSRVKKTEKQLAENLAFAGFIAQAQKALEADQHREGMLALKKAREITGMRQDKRVLELNDALGAGRQATGLFSCWPEYEHFSPGYPGIGVLAAGPEGQLVTSLEPKKMSLFDYRTGQELHKFGFPITDRIGLIRTSPDGALAAEFSSFTRVVRLWNLIRSCFATSIILDGGRALSMAFSGDGALFAVSSETDVSVYETKSFRMLARTDTGFEVSDLSFISETELLLVSKRKGSVQRWDREKTRFTVIHSGRERAPYFASSDGRYFLVQNEEGKAQIYQSSGELLYEISCEKEVHCCDFSRSGQILLVAGGEGSIYRLADGRCLHRFSGAYGRILQACFNPEGNRVLLGHEKSASGGGLSIWYLDRMFEV